MLAVFEKRNGVGAHDRMTNGKPHPVLFRQQTVARPIAPFHKIVGCFDILQAAHIHSALLV
jgi:hypothetical protein